MAKKKVKYFGAEFKTKIVLELLEGELTINQIASKHNITVKVFRTGKNNFLENASLAFDVAGATKTYRDEIEDLKQENEQLAKALGKTTVRADFAEES